MTDSAASPGGSEETQQNIRPLRPPTPGTNIDTDRTVNPNVDAQYLPTPSSQAQRIAKTELRRSYVSSITSKNLAGMVSNDGNGDEICIDLGDEPNLVAVTGETGSGKSVLIAKVASLVSGGPASPTMVPSSASEAVVEMTIQLAEPHLSMVESACRAVGVDASELVTRDADGLSAKLVLQRTLSLQPGSAGKPRLKSACQVNGKAVTLKAMKAIAGPLLTIVDAAAAASALSRPNSRLSVIDTAVPTSIKAEALRTKTTYRKARRHREALEQELNSQVLPPSYSHSDDPNEEAIEMLRHWVDELDAFEGRMVEFQESAVGGSSGSDDRATGSTQLSETLQRFRSASWFDYSNEKQSNGDASSTAVSEFYTQLLDFREVVKDMDEQLQAAVAARDALSAISLPDSAVTALERARNYLFDATGGQVGSTEDSVDQDIYSAAAEDAHERLNTVEMALSDCVKSLEDSNKGLLTTLGRMVDSVGVSLEDIDAIIADWNTLSRKHAISPFSLPSCHKALRSELDGSVEARLMLPKAKAAEEAALKEYEEACAELTAARQENCIRLSKAVTDRLPSLGILSQFEVRLNASVQRCTDPGAFGEGSGLGIDTVDFLLQHQTVNDEGELPNTNGRDTARGGKLESIGSAGEKARILLAIETELPGSVGALCRSGLPTLVDGGGDEWDDTDVQEETKSVVVIYDEIDSHVGGRAAVAMAKLLVEQTRPLSNGRISGSGGGQVICITHSPSVAAVADRHVVIQKAKDSDVDNADKFVIGTNPVLAALVDGNLREEELGRMCGGDLAREEALQFAAALLRDGELQRSPQ